MHPYGRVTLKKDFASGFSHIMVIFIGEDTKARHLPRILAQLRIIPKERVRKITLYPNKPRLQIYSKSLLNLLSERLITIKELADTINMYLLCFVFLEH